MIKVTGLWVKKDKEGNEFLSGSMGSLRYFVMRNGFKETDGENSPDFILYLDQNQGKSQSGDMTKVSFDSLSTAGKESEEPAYGPDCMEENNSGDTF